MRDLRLVTLTIWAITFVLVAGVFGDSVVSAAYPSLPDRSDELSTSTPSAIATHVFSLQILDTTDNLGSIEFDFCSNSPIEGDPCVPPSGLNASSAVLASQSGNTGFHLSSASTSTELVVDRTPSPPTSTTNTYEFTGVINPNSVGSFYVRISIHSANSATGPDNEFGGVALSTTNQLTITSVITPYITFCSAVTITNQDCSTATGNFIDLGTFTPNNTASAISQFAVETNADFGYSVSDEGTTLISGNNYIPALGSLSPSTPGVNQFGINLTVNSSPHVGSVPTGNGGIGNVTPNYDLANKFLFNSGDTLVSSTTSSLPQTFTVSYIANVSSQQAPGVYVTTISYICLGNF